MSSADADDPVVKEITVFLSKGIENLLLFQYPMRPSNSSYDDNTFLKSKIKPKNQEVHMEIALDTGSINYDHSRAENIALNAESNSKKDQEEERVFEGDMMDKMILKSSKALPKCSNYGVGIIQDGELHITPLKGVIQMRPQFDYLDKSDKKMRDDGRNNEEVEEEETSAKQVNVQFARNLPDHLKKMREQSFQHHSQKAAEEQWIDTIYLPSSSAQAELTRIEMFCSGTEERGNALNMTKQQYLDLLAPVMIEESYCRPNAPSHSSTLNYIRTLPLLDQVKIIIKDAKVLSFAQLRSLLSTDHETSSILKYLQQVAVLVQGNWIVNSELVYQKDTMSSYSGIPAELMCRARDYVLLYFTEHEYIDRKAISSVMKLPADEIREILVNLAKHQPKKGWKLIVPPNKDFPERYPEIAQRQETFWEAKRKHLRETLSNQNHSSQRQRRRSNRESIGSENEERNVGRGRKSLRDSSVSDNDSSTETAKLKKTSRGRNMSETS